MITLDYIVRTKNIGEIGQTFRRTLVGNVKKGVLELERQIKLSISTRLRNTLGKGYLNRVTGKLGKSFVHEVSDKGNTVEGSVWSELPYARIHEEGGIISAKSVSKLTIPLPGPNFGPARSLMGRTFVKKNTIFLKNEGEAIPIYLLRRSVQIPPRKYVTEAVNIATPRIEEILGKDVVPDVK